MVDKALKDGDDVDGHNSNVDYMMIPNKGWEEFWKDWQENDEAYRAYGFEEPMEPTFTCVQIAGVADNTQRKFNDKWNDYIEPCGTGWDGTETYAPQKSKTFKRIGQGCKRSTSCPNGCMCHNKRGLSGINPIGGPTVHGINFKKKYGHTQGEFKVIFRDAAVKQKRIAIDWIIEYYSDSNPDNYNKLIPTRSGFKNRMGYSEAQLKKDTYSGLKDKLLDMKEHTYSLVLHYCCGGNYYGWVKDSEHKYRYNINLYNFTNPTEKGWENALFGVTLHELGHLVDNILWFKLGVDPYPGDLNQDYDETTSYKHDKEKQKEDRGPYVTRKVELYARMFNLRWYFDVKRNITGTEWARLFMDKVNSGEIAWASNYSIYNRADGSSIPKPEFGIGNPSYLVWLRLTKEFIDRVWWPGEELHDNPPEDWTYDNIWSLVNKIRYNIGDDPDDPVGYEESGIGALLTSFTFDPKNFEVDNEDPNLFWVVFDFSKIAEANRLYVMIDPDELVDDSEEFAALEALYDGIPETT
jgi:hypothetical protein